MSKRHASIAPVHPGEILREDVFPALKITKPALLQGLPVPQRAQLMQHGKGQLHLRLDTRDTGQTTSRSLLGQVLEQRCLAHARFAGHD